MTSDKCPKCGALGYVDRQGDSHWACGSSTSIDLVCQSRRCIERQRDQLAARVKQLEAENEKLRGWVKDAYIEGAASGHYMGRHWFDDSRARARLEGRTE